MAPSSITGTSSEDLVSELQTSLRAIHHDKITVGGKQYHTVSPSKLAQLERRVDRALAHQGQNMASPTALIALHEELESCRRDLEKAQKDLDEWVEKEKGAVQEAKELRAKLAKHKEDFATARAADKGMKAKLLEDLKESQALRKEAEIKLASPEAKFDPEAAKQIQIAKDEAINEVKILQAKLQDMNAGAQERQSSINSLHIKLKAKEDEINLHKGRASQLKNALLAAEGANTQVQFSPAIEAMLGKDACLILANWRTVAIDDVKERAYIGMKGMSRHKNKLIAALGALFKQVFEWCKSNTMKARKVVKPWMDMVIEDIVQAKIKTVSFYRDELKKLMVIVDEKKASYRKAHPETEREDGFFSDLWFLGYALTLRVRRMAAPWYRQAWRYTVGAGRAIKAAALNWYRVVSMAVKSAIDGKSYQESKLEVEPTMASWGHSVRTAFRSAWPTGPRSNKDEKEPIFVTPEDAAPYAAPI